MLNQVVLVGRLTDDPVLEESVNGKQYTAVIVAVQRNFKNAQGLYDTDFIRCVLWNGLASNTKEYCKAGDVVGIKGRLQNRAYEDDNKEVKYITEVITEKITFLSNLVKTDEEKAAQKKRDSIVFVDVS